LAESARSLRWPHLKYARHSRFSRIEIAPIALKNPSARVVQQAVSAVIFNALIIIALIPLALRGIKYRPAPAPVLLRRNILVYGLGGVFLPFPCIKLIDLALSAVGVS
jgi:high-affinity K+ transport system ATPase subunit B